MRKLIVAATLLACTAGAAGAQQGSPAAPGGTPTAARDTTPHVTDPARLAAARELVGALNMQKVLDRSIETMLRVQTESNPAMAQFSDIMRAFFARYMTWEALRDSYAQIYADMFTADELRQLLAFYHSPVGQKVSTLTPELMERSSELGRQTVQAHLPELQEMIMARVQQNTAPPPAKPKP